MDLAAERGEWSPVEAVSRQLGDWHHWIYANTVWNRNAGTNHGVVSCDIYKTGAGGVSLGGGDRKTLTPAGNYVLNCHIHDFNRLDRSYRAGVNIDGVGNRIAHCLIHDAPNNAIYLFGNDHVIEYNELHHVCRGASDMGAFYMGRDPSQQGNVLRYNFFHHNGPGLNHLPGRLHQRRDRLRERVLQDALGGQDQLGARQHRSQQHLRQLGFHRWGHGRMDNRAWTGAMQDPLQVLRLRKALDVTQPPYVTRYPKLANTFDPSPDLRRGNEICGNVFVQSEGPRVRAAMRSATISPPARILDSWTPRP